ncbi:ER membrane protein complex subunit 7-like protein [Bienertia sinuspersici]
MASIPRSKLLLLFSLQLCFCLLLLPTTFAISSGQNDGFTINGRVRVDVSARNPGKVQAALTETRRGLTELTLVPLREEYYYEKREPFSLLSLVKSPMGLMVGFMLIVVFVMPKLMENMDPEEMRQAQEQMRSQGGLASLLGGAAAQTAPSN